MRRRHALGPANSNAGRYEAPCARAEGCRAAKAPSAPSAQRRRSPIVPYAALGNLPLACATDSFLETDAAAALARRGEATSCAHGPVSRKPKFESGDAYNLGH
jgi:hypothetical protein